MTDAVLIVEDDNDIAELIKLSLTELSIRVDWLATGEQVVEKAMTNQYALILLDVMLPGRSGLDICRELRDKIPTQSIMMLTSRNSEADRVVGLELGADDYMAKPFSIRELQARVRAQLRRFHIQLSHRHADQQQQNPEDVVKLGQLTIDIGRHQAELAGRCLDLTATEFDLLHFLTRHPGQVFSREQLLSSVWGYHHAGYEHTVNSHINRLRNKIEREPTKPSIVQTVWGVGYKLNGQGVCA